MLGVDRDVEASLPVFIPPRKRQSTKKPNGVQNYVDHIVSVQVNYPKMSSIELKYKLQTFLFAVAESSIPTLIKFRGFA